MDCGYGGRKTAKRQDYFQAQFSLKLKNKHFPIGENADAEIVAQKIETSFLLLKIVM